MAGSVAHLSQSTPTQLSESPEFEAGYMRSLLYSRRRKIWDEARKLHDMLYSISRVLGERLRGGKEVRVLEASGVSAKASHLSPHRPHQCRFMETCPPCLLACVIMLVTDDNDDCQDWGLTNTRMGFQRTV